MQQRQDLLLGRRLEVHQDVATADQVELGVRGVQQHVLARKDHRLAQLLADASAVVLLEEEAPPALRRHVADDALRVEADAGEVERARIDVRREDLQGDTLPAGLQLLDEQHRDRVGLFARGTAWHPHAQWGLGFLALDQRSDHPLLKVAPHLGVAEEARHADQEIFEQ